MRASAARVSEVSSLTPKSIAVTGGSVSAIGGLFVRALSTALTDAIIGDSAIRASNLAATSHCASQQLLVNGRPPDYVLIEFAPNDAIVRRREGETHNPMPGSIAVTSPHHSESSAYWLLESPLVSMERLLRFIRLYWPRTTPLVVYICGPGGGNRAGDVDDCEGMYSEVSAKYGVREISLRAELGWWAQQQVGQKMWKSRQWPKNITWDFFGIHPSEAAYDVVAQAVAREVRRCEREPRSLWVDSTSEASGRKSQMLAPPLYLDPAWEKPDRPWCCVRCTERGCWDSRRAAHVPGAQRVLNGSGFEVQPWSKDGVVGKWGYVGHSPSTAASFGVPPNSHVLVELLRADDPNFGWLDLWLGSRRAARAPIDNGGSVERNRSLPMRWRHARLTHRQIADVGVGSLDANALQLRMALPANASSEDRKAFRKRKLTAKLFGIFWQLAADNPWAAGADCAATGAVDHANDFHGQQFT